MAQKKGIFNLMYAGDQSMDPIMEGMHIHQALSEVVQGTFMSLMSAQQYRDMLVRGLI